MYRKEVKLTPQQYRKYNGQSIMSALSSMGNKGTLDDLSKHIAESINQPEEYVRSEVSNVLERGLNDGFLLKQGQYYVLPGDNNFEVDSTPQNQLQSYQKLLECECDELDEQSQSNLHQESLEMECDELNELKERQEIRNHLELSLFKMSLPQLREMHAYVNKFEGNKESDI